MGVVWSGPQRWAAATASLAIAVTPLVLATPASAGAASPSQGSVHGTVWGDKAADKLALDVYGRNDAKADPGSLYSITTAIGARALWASKDSAGRAITGQGVTVAIVDSGVAAVPGLDAPGKIVRGPDLSMEANSTQALGYDTFGHGTHLASIIGARDAVAGPNSASLTASDATAQLGVAPDARLLALKLEPFLRHPSAAVLPGRPVGGRGGERVAPRPGGGRLGWK
jgi:serine protease AprX